MGLFIGGSILTLLEVFDYFFDVIKVSFRIQISQVKSYKIEENWFIF